MVRDVFRQVTAGHPIRNKLERIGGDAQKGDNVWVRQVFPHHGYLVDGLWIPLGCDSGET